MAYTTLTKISAELKGFTIDGSSAPSSTDVTQWVAEGDAYINEKAKQVFESTVFTDTILDWSNLDDSLRLEEFLVS